MKIGIGMALTSAGGAPLGVQSAAAEVTGATEITFTLSTSYAYAGVAIRVSGSGSAYDAWFSGAIATSHSIVLGGAQGIAAGTTYEWYPYATTDPLDLNAALRIAGTGGTVLVPALSFTDSFNRANENLEASANWTRVGGVANAVRVVSNQLNVDASVSGGDTAYQCPSQSSANHYTQAVIQDITIGSSFHVCVRLTDASNFIGARWHEGNARYEVYKRNGGSFTLLGSYTVTAALGDVLKLTANGNSIEFFLNGVSRIGPVTDSFNNTEVRQGIVARTDSAVGFIDDFEAAAM